MKKMEKILLFLFISLLCNVSNLDAAIAKKHASQSSSEIKLLKPDLHNVYIEETSCQLHESSPAHHLTYRLRARLRQLRDDLPLARQAVRWKSDEYFNNHLHVVYALSDKQALPYYYVFLFRLTPF